MQTNKKEADNLTVPIEQYETPKAVREIISEAIQLIISKIEAEESSAKSEVVHREIVIKIKLKQKGELYPLITEKVYFGRAHDNSFLAKYSSGQYVWQGAVDHSVDK